MMKAVRQAWHDIRRGQNLGTYIAITTAFVFAVLKALEIASDALISGATLGLLGVLCASLLATRHQNADVARALARVNQERPLARRFLQPHCELAEITARFKASEEVWLWGTTLSTHIPALADDVKSALPKGLRLRVLMIEPGSAAMKMAAFRAADSSLPHDVESAEQELEGSLAANLSLLNSVAKRGDAGQLDYRPIDLLAPYVIYAFDPKGPNGALMVRLGTFRGPHDDRPTFWLSRTEDRRWFDHFVDQFEAVFAGAKIRTRSATPGEGSPGAVSS
jgi:hypothetical protein